MRHLKVSRSTTKYSKNIGAAFVAALLLSACAGQPPADLGIIQQVTANGAQVFSLRACPESPNCIQTYDATDQDHFKAPLPPKVNVEQTTQALKAAITDSGGTIVSEKKLVPDGYYLHAEYQSTWIRFVDDVEVIVQAGSIQLRSASRLGHSDFGVNGERFETIKTIYQAVPKDVY